MLEIPGVGNNWAVSASVAKNKGAESRRGFLRGTERKELTVSPPSLHLGDEPGGAARWDKGRLSLDPLSLFAISTGKALHLSLSLGRIQLAFFFSPEGEINSNKKGHRGGGGDQIAAAIGGSKTNCLLPLWLDLLRRVLTSPRQSR